MKHRFLAIILISAIFMPIANYDATEVSGRNLGTVSIEYFGNANDVFVTGEWNWSENIELEYSDGHWSVDLDLEEGLYCYKLIVDGEYIFDPDNQERGYCGDYENSLLRVKNHLRPQFSAELNENHLTIFYHPGSTGALLSDTPAAIPGASWDSADMSWNYNISNLADGKHSLLIEGTDTEGNIAYDLLVPFWKGNSSNFEWEDALIYMIMTDRFVNGNSSNDGALTGAEQGAEWQGGDFEGVKQMIDSGYFSELGVNAIWLSPFNTAATYSGKAADGVHDVSSFHGYWPIEARQIEPRLGTEQDLHNLVQSAHDAGIRVMMDFVVNHVHEEHPYFQENPDWFNSGCICGTNSCDWTEYRLECQFTSYMPDVNWKNRNASEQFISDAIWWLENFNLDGARIDAVKHVEDLAIRNLASQINDRFETVGTDYYLKGETAMGWAGHSLEANLEQYQTINSYMGTEGLDGQADFVLYHAVVDNVFVSKSENYQHLDYWTNRSQDQYTPGSIMVPYVGSHDVPRLASRADSGTSDAYNQWVEDGLPGQPGNKAAYDSVLQAYAWLLTTPGAPLIYYGDEYGEFGGADPDNRHMYRNSSQWSNYELELYENISSIGKIRIDSEALRKGVYSTVHAEADRLVYSMKSDNQEMHVILNRGSQWQWAKITDSDKIIFGEQPIDGNLPIPENSVTIIERISIPNSNQTDSIQGCTDSTAVNFDPDADDDDGSCEYDQNLTNQSNSQEENQTQSGIEGCMNPDSVNFNSNATKDDGSCILDVGKTNSSDSTSEKFNSSQIVRIVLFVGVVVAAITLLAIRKN